MFLSLRDNVIANKQIVLIMWHTDILLKVLNVKD